MRVSILLLISLIGLRMSTSWVFNFEKIFDKAILTLIDEGSDLKTAFMARHVRLPVGESTFSTSTKALSCLLRIMASPGKRIVQNLLKTVKFLCIFYYTNVATKQYDKREDRGWCHCRFLLRRHWYMMRRPMQGRHRVRPLLPDVPISLPVPFSFHALQDILRHVVSSPYDKPGATALTVIPFLPNSFGKCLSYLLNRYFGSIVGLDQNCQNSTTNWWSIDDATIVILYHIRSNNPGTMIYAC